MASPVVHNTLHTFMHSRRRSCFVARAGLSGGLFTWLTSESVFWVLVENERGLFLGANVGLANLQIGQFRLPER